MTQQEILNIFELQMSIYNEMEQLTDQAIAKQSKGMPCDQLMRTVDEKTLLIQQNNQRLQQLLQSVDGGLTSLSQQIKQSKKDIENKALSVLLKTQQLENDLKNTRDGMLPTINKQVVASKMFRAYQKDS